MAIDVQLGTGLLLERSEWQSGTMIKDHLTRLRAVTRISFVIYSRLESGLT